MADWRIYAFDLDGNGGVVLNDGDLLAKAQPTRELSGPGSVALTLAPEQDVTITPWKTLIVVTLGNSIRGTGIVSSQQDNGDGALSVTCTGVTGYYADLPADMERTYANVDPARVIYDMLRWAASQRGMNVGLDLATYKDTGVRVGNPDPPVTKPRWTRKKPVLKAIPKEPKKTAYKDYYLKGNTADKVARRKAARDAYNAAMKTWRATRDAIKKENSAKEKEYKDARKEYESKLKEYNSAIDDAKVKVQWWENPTVGGIIDDMAKSVEYRVVPRWRGSVPDHTITVGKRIGRRQTGLRFVVGENVIDSPQVDWAGETYATKVVFLGAGEGKAMIRGVAEGKRNGLARTVVISDQSVRSKKLAEQRAARALKWRQSMPQVGELVIVDDDNAPFGTFDVGDEIRLIDPGQRWAGPVDMWVRILSITEDTESPTASLTVTRTDIGE